MAGILSTVGTITGRHKAISLGAALLLGFVVAVPLAGGAAVGPPYGHPSISCPASAPAGTTITVTGSGFPARTAVLLSFDGRTVGGTATKGNGSFSATPLVPPTASVGSHTITATAVRGTVTASCSVEVTPGRLSDVLERVCTLLQGLGLGNLCAVLRGL